MRRILLLVTAGACLALLIQITLKWHTIQGVVFFSLDNHAEAIRKFQMATQENPDSLYAQYYLGQSYFEIKDYPQAIYHLNKATMMVPDHHKAKYLLGISLAASNQSKQAIVAIRSAIELDPSIAQYHFQRIY